MVEFETTPEVLKESLELIKNTKGYTWKIKLKPDEVTDAVIERIGKLNNRLEEEYGNDTGD